MHPAFHACHCLYHRIKSITNKCQCISPMPLIFQPLHIPRVPREEWFCVHGYLLVSDTCIAKSESCCNSAQLSMCAGVLRKQCSGFSELECEGHCLQIGMYTWYYLTPDQQWFLDVGECTQKVTSMMESIACQ